jgi:hypothetical protein
MFFSKKQLLITGNGFTGYWLPELLVAGGQIARL